MNQDPRLKLEMYEAEKTSQAVAQAVEIPAKDLNNALNLLRAQAESIKHFEEVSHVQTSRIKFKLLKGLEAKVDEGSIDFDEMLKFYSVVTKTEDPEKNKPKGGLAEHLEEMMGKTKDLIADRTIADAKKYQDLEKNIIDVNLIDNDNSMPNI